MSIGDWIITIQNFMYSWAYQNKQNIWTLPIRILIYVTGFLFFQLTNLYAQLRWPFSALFRFVKSFWAPPLGEPIPVNDVKLHKLIEENQVVLVDFWTEWCGPCILMEGSLKEFAKQYKDEIVVAKVDATINPKLKKKYNVMGYPTLLLFFEGREIVRTTGSQNVHSLGRFVHYYLLKEKTN